MNHPSEEFHEKDKEVVAPNGYQPFKEGATILGIRFAPFDIPWERRLQTLATFLLITWFMGGWIVSTYIFYRFFCTKLFLWIPLLYLAWYV